MKKRRQFIAQPLEKTFHLFEPLMNWNGDTEGGSKPKHLLYVSCFLRDEVGNGGWRTFGIWIPW